MAVALPVAQTRPAGPVVAVLIASTLIGCALFLMVVQARPPHGGFALVAGMVVPAVFGAALGIRRTRLTHPDLITLGRVGLTGVLAAAAVLIVVGPLPQQSWAVCLPAAAALSLDAIDGWLARRTGTVTETGAKLDMEADAALLLVLSIAVSASVGPWVLAIGAMRYVFVAATWVRPRLRNALAFSQYRRVVAAIQGVCLASTLCPLVPRPVGIAVCLFALILLLVSFVRDVISLETAGVGGGSVRSESRVAERT